MSNSPSWIVLSLALFVATSTAGAQSPAEQADKLQEQGIAFGRAGKLDEAVAAFSKAIEFNPYDHHTWFYRGISKGLMGNCTEAIADLDKTLELAPEFPKAYLERGSCKVEIMDDAGALSDFNAAIELDSTYAEAYYNRGLLLEVMHQRDAACEDFSQAVAFGVSAAQSKIEQCGDSTARAKKIYAIRKLTSTAPDGNYGFSSDHPVKVGHGPNGGPANQRAYLDLLRDGKGKAVSYKRLGSCCAYPSENGLFGAAMVDRYEVSYLNEKGKRKKTVVHISFYDYEEPLIPQGFGTVGRP